MEKSENSSLIDKLIDLYLSVKVRSAEDIENFTKEKREKERGSLLGINPLLIIDYIKSSIEILLSLKEEQNRKSNYNSMESGLQDDYEIQIQKLEAEARMHIRVFTLNKA